MMSSNLHQLQLNYDQLQDRLTLILLTQDFCEYRFWITRRVAKAFLDMLMKLLEKDQKDQLRRLQEEQQIAEQIQKEKEQHHPGADRYGTSVTRRPLGDEPLLLYKVMAKSLAGGHFLLHLEDPQGRSLEVGGDSKIVLALFQLVEKSALKAEWNLNFKEPL